MCSINQWSTAPIFDPSSLLLLRLTSSEGRPHPRSNESDKKDLKISFARRMIVASCNSFRTKSHSSRLYGLAITWVKTQLLIRSVAQTLFNHSDSAVNTFPFTPHQLHISNCFPACRRRFWAIFLASKLNVAGSIRFAFKTVANGSKPYLGIPRAAQEQLRKKGH